MKKIVCLLPLFLIGCAIFKQSRLETLTLSPKEKAYVQKIQNQPLQFSVPNSMSERAWSRANSFIAQYASTKIQTANKYVIQTYDPLDVEDGSINDFEYSVNRTIGKDSTKFNINCSSPGFRDEDAINNAKILAYYIQTGNLPFQRLIAE